MTDLHTALGTVGAIVAQRHMIDLNAMDMLADSSRAYPDADNPDEATVKGRIDRLVTQLSLAAQNKPAPRGVIPSGRGARIACAGSSTSPDGSMSIGIGTIAMAKIVAESGNPSFEGKSGEIIRTLVGNLPKPEFNG